MHPKKQDYCRKCSMDTEFSYFQFTSNKLFWKGNKTL